MAKRRGNQEGSLYQRFDGRWCAQVTLDGHRLTHYAKTQRECREWIKETLAKVDEGLNFSGARIKVGEFLEQWLETAKPSLRPRTWIQYRQVIRQHVLPKLGNLKLKNLRPGCVKGSCSACAGPTWIGTPVSFRYSGNFSASVVRAWSSMSPRALLAGDWWC
jgi:hypothetical protein